ncbi:RNA-binding S4 domain-containing protein [Acidisoma sp.]|uniref:RNA-binding S4 domain-containing protein n=1 Tax=Acidisoma sp. TaxID=1872115 RepID=UPI003B002868
MSDKVEWQRLDLWLWCARVAKARSDCARLVEAGGVRLNRQPTVKAHAKLRIGDVLTMALRGEVRVWRVRALASRRGPAAEASLLYEVVPEDVGGDRTGANSCANSGSAAYEGAQALPEDGGEGAHDQSGFHETSVEPAGNFRTTATRSAE